MKLQISILAEPIFHLGDIAITNSMFTGVIVSVLLVGFSYWLNKKLEKKSIKTGMQNAVEMLIEALYNLMISITGERKAKQFFPLVTTFFLFILFSNWMELLPGVGTVGIKSHLHGKEIFAPFIRPPSADINATIALALISVIMTQAAGFKQLRAGYLLRFFNFRSPMKFFLGILELISETTKIISFSFRLFGNIFAGEVLLMVSLALMPFLAPIPFLGLEIFVGTIQAFVFAILTLVFMNIATIPHNEEH